jgi:hypothetical protein
MNQHEFVARCQAAYAKLGLEPGNPDDGEWQDAHYPAPDPEGDTTIPLLFADHQIQGILQSEEYGRCCFWSGDTKTFLDSGPFVEGWFELWDVYEKWQDTAVEKLHTHPDASEWRSRGGKKAHEEKDELGRSVLALKSVERMCAVIHEEKDEFGRSVKGVEAAMKMNSHQWQNTHPDWPAFITTSGPLSNWQKKRGIPTEFRIRLPNDS